MTWTIELDTISSFDRNQIPIYYGDVAILEHPRSPRYEVRFYWLDLTEPQVLMTTDRLAEAEAIFRQAIKDL